MARTKHLNRLQKRAFKAGEQRISGSEISRYVDLSKSENPKDRLEAAENLCPCHVRRRIDEVWDALYAMLEDPDEKVRRAAYHTLEDGGRPDDPKLTEIFERAWETESNKAIRGYLTKFFEGRKEREFVEAEAQSVSPYHGRGKCDFCGCTNVKVRHDLDTEIAVKGDTRAALICASCDG